MPTASDRLTRREALALAAAAPALLALKPRPDLAAMRAAAVFAGF